MNAWMDGFVQPVFRVNCAGPYVAADDSLILSAACVGRAGRVGLRL